MTSNVSPIRARNLDNSMRESDEDEEISPATTNNAAAKVTVPDITALLAQMEILCAERNTQKKMNAANLQQTNTTNEVNAADKSKTDIPEGESRGSPSDLEDHENQSNEDGETQNAGLMEDDPSEPG